jgi:hypothetical protein
MPSQLFFLKYNPKINHHIKGLNNSSNHYKNKRKIHMSVHSDPTFQAKWPHQVYRDLNCQQLQYFITSPIQHHLIKNIRDKYYYPANKFKIFSMMLKKNKVIGDLKFPILKIKALYFKIKLCK